MEASLASVLEAILVELKAIRRALEAGDDAEMVDPCPGCGAREWEDTSTAALTRATCLSCGQSVIQESQEEVVHG